MKKMNKKQIASATVNFINEFCHALNVSNINFTQKLTSASPLCAQFKHYELFAELRVDVWVDVYDNDKLKVQLSSISATDPGALEVIDTLEITIANIDEVVKKAVAFFTVSEAEEVVESKEAKEARQIAEQIERELSQTIFPAKYFNTLKRNLNLTQAKAVARHLDCVIADDETLVDIVDAIYHATLENISAKESN